MSETKVFSFSAPTALVKRSQTFAKKNHMTQSELIRTALREYVEMQQAKEAINIAQTELQSGKLKTLKGSLASLI